MLHRFSALKLEVLKSLYGPACVGGVEALRLPGCRCQPQNGYLLMSQRSSSTPRLPDPTISPLPHDPRSKKRATMPPPSAYQSRSGIRPSLAPSNTKARQLAHLNSQLAQLQAHLADLQDIMRVTAVQAENIKALGGLNGALLISPFPPFFFSSSPPPCSCTRDRSGLTCTTVGFRLMAAGKVLGDEGGNGE